MKQALAQIYLIELLDEIGPGFHLDTPISDYTPEFKNEKELQMKLDFAFEHIKSDIYEYALNLYNEKFNAKV